MGTHMRVLSESFPMNTNMVGFLKTVFINLCILVLWTKVATALEGLRHHSTVQQGDMFNWIDSALRTDTYLPWSPAVRGRMVRGGVTSQS